MGRFILRLVGALVLLALAAPAAHAATGHTLARQFSSPGTGAGQLGPGGPVAVSPANGDVYVPDNRYPTIERIERFSPDGTFVSDFSPAATPQGSFGPTGVAQIAIAAGGDVFVVAPSNNAVYRFRADGTYAPQDEQLHGGPALDYPRGVAVDPGNGNVFVSGGVTGEVSQYAPDGSFVKTIDGFVQPGNVAVDASHRLYVTNDGGDVTLLRFDAPYDAPGVAVGPIGGRWLSSSVAIDPSNQHVLIGDGTYGLVDYAAGGQTRESQYSTQSTLGGAAGADGTLYVHTADGVVAVYAPATVPRADTNAAQPVRPLSATLRGTLDPSGLPTTYHFEFGADAGPDKQTWPSSTPTADAGSGTGDREVTAALGNLLPKTTYHARLVIDSPNGPNIGRDVAFRTPPSPPGVTGPTLIVAGRTRLSLKAAINPYASTVTYHYEYGTTSSYGSETPPLKVNEQGTGNSGDEAVDRTIEGLRSNTTYHVRLVATSEGGRTAGPDRTFRTLPPLADAALAPATDLTPTSATAHGSVDTHGLAGSYRFVVRGTDSTFSLATTPTALAAHDGSLPVSAALGGLPPGGTFSLQLVVTTAGGTALSPIATFSTLGGPAGAAATPVAPDVNPYGCVVPVLVCGYVPPTATPTPPSSAFSASGKADGTSIALKLTLPGAGRVTADGAYYAKRTGRPSKAGVYTIHARLTLAARSALAHVRTRKLTAPIAVTYTRSGGTPATRTTTVTFTRSKKR